MQQSRGALRTLGGVNKRDGSRRVVVGVACATDARAEAQAAVEHVLVLSVVHARAVKLHEEGEGIGTVVAPPHHAQHTSKRERAALQPGVDLLLLLLGQRVPVGAEDPAVWCASVWSAHKQAGGDRSRRELIRTGTRCTPPAARQNRVR